jgi:hypothetical protein
MFTHGFEKRGIDNGFVLIPIGQMRTQHRPRRPANGLQR